MITTILIIYYLQFSQPQEKPILKDTRNQAVNIPTPKDKLDTSHFSFFIKESFKDSAFIKKDNETIDKNKHEISNKKVKPN